VRFRIDGTLYEQPTPPRHHAEALVSRVKVMAHMDIAERRLPQDGMAQVRVGERAIDVRVSTVPVADGERVVMRLLDRDNALLPLSALGMPDTVLAPFETLLAMPNGLVVVSGPTGSGKTTTLYSALGSLDATRRNILTVEEPVEYRLPAIGQIQVRPKIGLTFASGLRHILRQDPDVILVGETRDTETAEIAVRAALTGHLVFTTLHTNDAPSAVARLVDMGVEPYLLASCLRGVLAQRLVRRLCPLCRRRAAAPDAPASAAARSLLAEVSLDALHAAAGCAACLDGYKGRVGLFELMPCGGAIVESIHQSRVDAESLRTVAATAGYQPLRADAVRKLRAGVTDLREVAAALAG
jgi:general secretion pathway protein E